MSNLDSSMVKKFEKLFARVGMLRKTRLVKFIGCSAFALGKETPNFYAGRR